MYVIVLYNKMRLLTVLLNKHKKLNCSIFGSPWTLFSNGLLKTGSSLILDTYERLNLGRSIKLNTVQIAQPYYIFLWSFTDRLLLLVLSNLCHNSEVSHLCWYFIADGIYLIWLFYKSFALQRFIYSGGKSSQKKSRTRP